MPSYTAVKWLLGAKVEFRPSTRFRSKKFALEGERELSALAAVSYLCWNAPNAHRAQTRPRQQRPRSGILMRSRVMFTRRHNLNDVP